MSCLISNVMSNQINLHLPAFWHFSCNSCMPSTRIRFPISLGAGVIILVLLTFFIFLYFSRNQSFAEPIRIGNHPPHSNLVTSHGDGSLYHYGAVIDCGSSGSRLFIYTWPTHGGNPGHLLSIRHLRDGLGRILVKRITPGLSTLSANPGQAGRYIRPLLEFATRNIPPLKLRETPLYILATAGLRVLSERVQNAILDNVRAEVRDRYHFLFNDNQVEVITGKQEGIFAWISVNYILERFQHQDPAMRWDGTSADSQVSPPFRGHVRRNTVGVIDMGGGSAQIAYEVDQTEQVDNNLLAEFNLGCRTSDSEHLYRLYVTTFLGLGVNSARRRYEDDIIARANVTSTSNVANVTSTSNVANVTLVLNSSTMSINTSSTPVNNDVLPPVSPPILPPVLHDPCLPHGLNQTRVVNNTSYIIQGSGDYSVCRGALSPLLNLSQSCVREPCTINGLHLPPINFTSAEFMGFSEYFYSTEGLLNDDGIYEFKKYDGASKMYCSTQWSVIEQRYRPDLFYKATSDRRRSQCFKSAWISEVLHNGLRFPTTFTQFKPVKTVEGHEVQWTLGALLYKTRYFPLREVQRQEFERYRPPWKATFIHHYITQYFLTACIILVILSIIIYLTRLSSITLRARPPAPGPNNKMTMPAQYLPAMSVKPSEEVVIIQGEVFR